MSELKARTAYSIAIEEKDLESSGTTLVYFKSEADKVIAEKDETIDELKERIDELQKATDSAWGKVNTMYDELRHNKYKRCLAMARWCRSRACFYDTMRENSLYWGWKSDKAYKWHKRWLTIAEKFKPNSTAQ